LLQKVGFENAEIVGDTGFNSSPKTKGVLLRAEKPAIAMHNQELTTSETLKFSYRSTNG
jgi:hypothetical protein